MLYEILMASKLGAAATVAAPDMLTGLMASKMPFAKGAIASMSGVPPLSFRANGEPLIECLIYGTEGGVGDHTANLYDNTSKLYQAYIVVASNQWRGSATAASVRIPCSPLTTYTISTAKPYSIFRVAECASDDTPIDGSGASNVDITVLENGSNISKSTVTTSANAKYLVFQANANTASEWMSTLNVNVGPAQLPYEPYGYKIPISCGNVVTNVYIDSPLNAGDSISATQAGVQIPTVRGSNTLTVDTTVQPSGVYIKYRR